MRAMSRAHHAASGAASLPLRASARARIAAAAATAVAISGNLKHARHSRSGAPPVSPSSRRARYRRAQNQCPPCKVDVADHVRAGRHFLDRGNGRRP